MKDITYIKYTPTPLEDVSWVLSVVVINDEILQHHEKEIIPDEY